MPFIGTPTIELVTPNLVRITGLSLAAQAATTIGLSGAAGTPSPEIVLPPQFQLPTFGGKPIALVDGIRISIDPVSGAPGPFTNLPPSREKIATTVEDFRIVITNTKVDLPTQTLEIYIESLSSAQPSGARTVNIYGPLIAGDENIG